MKFSVAFILLVSSVCPAGIAFTQCQADSVVSYVIIGGEQKIASTEYFTYDANDSLVNVVYKAYSDENPVQTTLTSVTRTKKKGALSVATFVQPGGGTSFTPSHEMSKYDKKGRLVEKSHGGIDMADGEFVVVQNYKITYAYDKAGELVSQLSVRKDETTSEWNNETLISYSYNEQGRTTAFLTQDWNAANKTWKDSWKTTFAYDSAGTVTEIITYKFEKGVRLPNSRTAYELNKEQQVKHQVVFRWNGAGSAWENEFYYVMTLNELGKTKTEVHMSWVDSDWQITLTVHYLYNEQGEIYQVLNDKQMVIMDRYCR